MGHLAPLYLASLDISSSSAAGNLRGDYGLRMTGSNLRYSCLPMADGPATTLRTRPYVTTYLLALSNWTTVIPSASAKFLL